MFSRHLESVYKSLLSVEQGSRGELQRVVSVNEELLNEITRRITISSVGGGPLDERYKRVTAEVDRAVEDLIRRCGNNVDVDKILRVLRTLLRYIDQLYGIVKDVDLPLVKTQLEELEAVIKTLNS